MWVGHVFPSKVAIDEEGIRLTWERWSPERKYVGSFIPWASIRDGDPTTFPPEIRLLDGRTAFLPRSCSDELQAALWSQGVTVVRRPMVWNRLLEPFLDTDYEIFRERCEADLRRWGFTTEDIKSVRERLRRRMIALTALTWEWGGYGQTDALLAWSLVRIPPRTAPWFSYRRFRGWTDEIADRPTMGGTR